jgi:hypothetical protein
MIETRGYAPQREKRYERSPFLFWFVGLYVQVMRMSGKMSRG